MKGKDSSRSIDLCRGVTLNSAANLSAPTVTGFHPGSTCHSETSFDLNNFEAGSSFDVAACLPSFDSDFGKLIGGEIISIPSEYLLVCDTCKRCSMCSCYLGCSECNHSDTEEICVHCDKCHHDWLLIEGEDEMEDDSSSSEIDTSEGQE